MATRTLTFTLPTELADKLEEALQTDRVKLEEIAMGWLFFGRGIAEPGAQRPFNLAAGEPDSPKGT